MINYIDKKNTYIDSSVVIEDNVTIYPNVFIKGNSIIKSGTTIFQNSTILNSCIGENNQIGPNAFIRDNTRTDKNCKIGFCVEIKNSTIGEKTKIPHLSYIGDAVIGSNVNYGAGSITANYDGINKNKTEIGDDVFVGSNSTLVAPVKIMNNSLVAAGSVITKTVPKETLAIARERQINKENYYSKDRV
ncbi:MAG: DapH/DapD/GlmU-related protein [Bacilli bacterium]